MVKAGGGSGTLVTDLEFNKYASNVVGYDPVAKQLYDLGSIDIVMNLASDYRNWQFNNGNRSI
jgi:hypothetical protein